mmetsp:Transcript_8499/g.11698  ORF Transcript_8499/g.11698 Transcript_8499/m.11698 type:complete len:207 (-) Transcript_8499:470-1090(-)
MMHSEHTTTTTTTTTTSSSSADSKILTDLSTLSDQIELCQSMLGTSTYPHTSNEALLAVIGFLEACVPRMVELVDAAAQGALNEDTLEHCLEINDALLKTLANFDDPDYKGGGGTAKAPPPSAASSGGETGAEGIAGDLDDLLLDGPAAAAPPVAGGGKSTGEDMEDPFAGEPDLLTPTPAAVPSTGNAKSGGEDEFDAFLKERKG